MDKKIRIGALISGGGTNLQAIIDSCESGTINGEMVFVGSDNPDAYGLERSRKHGIPTFVVDYKTIMDKFSKDQSKTKLPDDLNMDDLITKQSLFKSGSDPEKIKRFMRARAVAEAEIIKNIKPYQFDLLVLAGFMRNLTPYFIDKVNINPDKPRIMNIHPALLPSFQGIDGYGDTFRYGCKVGGVSVHFVDYGEDTGPIIGQKAFRILPEDTLDSIKEKGLKIEWELYPECIRMFSEGRLELIKVLYNQRNQKKYRTCVRIIPRPVTN